MAPFNIDDRAVVRGRWLLWSMALLLLLLALWAHYAMLDEMTRAAGRVIPSKEVQIIQSAESGIVEEILVTEGEQVEPGQILMRINDMRFSASYQESRVELVALLGRTARLRAESRAESVLQLPQGVSEERPDIAAWEMQLFTARLQEQQASLSILQRQRQQRLEELDELKIKQQQTRTSYQLANRELTITAPLVKQGVMSEIELLRLQREVNDLKGSLEAMGVAEKRVSAALSESDARIEEQQRRYQRTVLGELAESSARLEQLQETMPVLQQRLQQTALRSPVQGVVKQIHINTVGGVVEAAQPLIEVVPQEDGLLIEAAVMPADIAFLYPGQQAIVRFTAYDFSIYGGLSAQVEHISADSLVDAEGVAYYRVLLRTATDYIRHRHESLPIIPGMVVEVDILTGKKSLLNYLLKPLHRMEQRALSER